MSAPPYPVLPSVLPSVLAVMAHPDDAELWAGGTLALHAESGAKVTVAVISHGPVRDAEARESTTILGTELVLLPSFGTLPRLLTELSPEVVITHPVADVHPDHRSACQALLDVLPDVVIATGRPRKFYSCDTYNGLTLHGPTNPHTIVDVSGTFDTKMRALQAHRSQPIADHFGPMAENLARLHGARIGTTHAEAFTPIPVLGRLPAAAHL